MSVCPAILVVSLSNPRGREGASQPPFDKLRALSCLWRCRNRDAVWTVTA